MKLTNKFRNLTAHLPSLTKYKTHKLALPLALPIGIIAACSVVFMLVTGIFPNFLPTTIQDKRFYLLLVVYLVYALKLLILDYKQLGPIKVSAKFMEIQKRFTSALEFLKKTTINKNGHSVSLNQLPWYLLIGNTDAGKTSFLAHSDINFILQKRKDSLDKNSTCDWWVTRDLCILDVPGKYISADNRPASAKHSPLSSILLELIKKIKGKKAIKGIIITLSIADLLDSGQTIKDQQTNVLAQLNQISALFQPQIPYYIVLTKCDLIPGFKEFFNDISLEEISQAWGISFNGHEEKISAALEKNFNQLIKKVNQQLITKLHNERNPLAKPYIKDFPIQLERIKSEIKEFVKLMATHYSNFVLRGTYFTSALQLPPDDFVIPSTERNHTERGLQVLKNPTVRSQAYFIKQLIAHGFASTQIEIKKLHSQWKYYSGYAAAFSLILIFGSLLGQDFRHGLKQTTTLQQAMNDFKLTSSLAQTPQDQVKRTILLLNNLRDASEAKDYHLALLAPLHFYSDKSRKNAESLYHQALTKLFIPPISHLLSQELAHPIAKDADEIYSALNLYLSLDNPKNIAPAALIETLKTIFAAQKDMAGLSNDIEMHLANALTNPWPTIELDESLIQDTRSYLTSLPKLKLSFVILKNLHNTLPTFNLLPFNDRKIFKSAMNLDTLPVIYTAKLYSTILSREIRQASEEALKGNWTLGEIQTNAKVSAVTLANDLRDLYLSNYIAMWENILVTTHLSIPKDLNTIDAALQTLASSNSPLQNFLATLHENTYFQPIVDGSSKLQSIAILIDNKNTNAISMKDVLEGLEHLHQYLAHVTSAPDESKAAFQLVSSRMEHKQQPDPLTQFRIIAEKAPNPLKRWMENIADETWKLLMQNANKYLNTAWVETVVPSYRESILGKFPFTAQAKNELSVQQFAKFFGKPGVLVSYYDNYLRNIIDTSTPIWQSKSMDNKTFNFPQGFIKQIQLGMEIHQAFFPNDDNKPSLQFALRRHKLGSKVKSFDLFMNDQQIKESRTTHNNIHYITWPTHNRFPKTTVKLVMNNDEIVKREYVGEWGWYKLLNQSVDSVINNREFMLDFSMNDNPAQYYFLTEAHTNPLSINLDAFKLPETLA